MNLQENIQRIKQMIGTNKSVVPFQLFGITERLVGYKTAHFALYAHLFNKLYDAYEKGNLEEEYSILINDNKSNKKMVKYFYDFIINNNEYFENKKVFTENNMKKIIKLTESDLIRIINKVINESDPKTGTGKKPQGSDRRLYTDENPSDTVSVKFKTKEDIVDTLNKESFKSKPHKRQSQIINLIHQRVRAAYQNASDPETKKRLKRGLDYIENEKEKSKEKTIKLQKEEQTEGELTEKCWTGYTQKGMKTMFGKRYPNCVKKTK